MRSTERVHFRLIKMPCCGFLYCNVNPRLLSYCIECGTSVISGLREHILISDDSATLKYEDGLKKPP